MHSSNSGRPKAPGGRRGWAIPIVAAALLAALVPVAPWARSSEPVTSPRIVGRLPRFGADVAARMGVPDLKRNVESQTDGGLALVYPKLDRLYQIYNFKPNPVGEVAHMVIAERDLETLELKRIAQVQDRQAELANGDIGAEWAATFDNANDRLYVYYRPRGGASGYAQAINGQNLPGVVGLDLKTFAVTDSPFPRFTADAASSAFVTVGLEYDESTDTLLVLQVAEFTTAGSINNVGLVGWTGDELRKGGELAPKTPRTVRSCRRDPINNRSSRYFTPILVAKGPDLDGDGSIKNWVMFPCFSTSASANVVIARLDRATALQPNSTQEKAVVAPAGVLSWAMDTTHGRLFMTNYSSETDTWVYEAASNAFVGIIEMSPKGSDESYFLSMGVDEGSGRLYARAKGNGLMIAAAALDPVPQADVYPELSAQGSYRILVDPKRSRIFSLTGSSTGFNSAPEHYEIIEVPPVLAVPPKEDPDTRTLQIDEEAGRTVAQYGGNATAYGLRVLLARGVSGAVPTNGNASFGNVVQNVNSYCGFTERELVLGGVTKTELSDTSRFAEAAAVNVDSATVTDLKLPSRCDIYNTYNGEFSPVNVVLPFANVPGAISSADSRTAGTPAPPLGTTINSAIGPRTAWDYVPADCSRNNGTHVAGPNSAPFAGRTRVDCEKPDDLAAAAEGHLRNLPEGSISVGRATASTRVYRDPKRGLVATATSRLENVRIGDISIGFITNKATSYAKGRAGTAKTEWEKPRIGFVEGPGIPSCTDQCDLDALIRQFNSLATGRAEFRRVPPETRLAAGSPGGYEAAIIKSEKQKASDNSLSGDKSVEIPALELVIYNDNPYIGRARQVFQFAGVRVDSHYGIQRASDAGACLSCLAVGTIIDETGEVVAALPALPPTVGTIPAAKAPGLGERLQQTFTNVGSQLPREIARDLKLLFSNPRQALARFTVWLLLLAPLFASRRRRALLATVAAHRSRSQSQ